MRVTQLLIIVGILAWNFSGICATNGLALDRQSGLIITTQQGNVYREVEVLTNRCDGSGIIIRHKAGVARIAFNEMKDFDKERYGYNPQRERSFILEQAQAKKNAEKFIKDNERQIWAIAIWTPGRALEDAKAKYEITDRRFRAYVEELSARYDTEVCRKFGITEQQLNGILDKGNQENWPRERPAAETAAIVADAGTQPVNSAWDGSVSAVKSYLKNHLRDPRSVEYTQWGTVRFKKLVDGYYWVVVVNYRAKNAFGGYTVDQGEAYIRNNEVVRFDLLSSQ